ncbi:MAG TPA: polyprenyl diphosphate synthase [Gammaproteobacteria bacterium]|nr:polyprenyl diphosphate synthase [Ktedonobacteraceae bacterium]HVC29245.1 polyprenyl diphosphate synthase [Gammaproteobacteria bacterium]
MVKTEIAILPRHIAIIMDGNGRWAKKRFLPRQAGHRAGLKAARRIIEACAQNSIAVLTLFAFSSENWQRPRTEVSNLIELFVGALESEVADLHKNNIRIRFIGDCSAFTQVLQDGMFQAEKLTQLNTGLILNIAVSYGGRWDMLQAVKKICLETIARNIRPEDLDEDRLSRALALSGLPDPDLFIRTGGERRISNFLLWNLAYTELYFMDDLWPDFDSVTLQVALDWYATRQRRFGRTSGQLGTRS